MKLWEDFLRPVVTLVVICVVTSALLAYTNGVTAPIIEENTIRIANETRTALLPEAEGAFTEVEVDVENVTEAYAADNGAGYVISAAAKGYGGDVPVMVAFSADGEIVAVKFLDNDETPGLGQKVKDAAFQDQFAGRAASEMTLSDIDGLSGATFSTNGALNGVNAAIKAYQTITGEG